jgi:hypothetical protein
MYNVRITAIRRIIILRCPSRPLRGRGFTLQRFFEFVDTVCQRTKKSVIWRVGARGEKLGFLFFEAL